MLVECATPERLTHVAISQAQFLRNNGPFYAGEAHTGKTSSASGLLPDDQKMSSFEPPNADRSADEGCACDVQHQWIEETLADYQRESLEEL